MGLLDGKVAIVTGAGGGIGRSHALRLSREGAKVVVNDLGGARDGTGSSVSAAQKVVDEIRAAGGVAVANADSVAEPEGAEGIVQTAVKEFGGLDILINNAGILRDKTLRKMAPEEFDLVVKVHLRGTFLCLTAGAKVLIEQGRGGRIINTSSGSGLVGNFGQGNYGAAKAGIYGLTRVAHLEFFDKYRITVNALVPVALTRMTEDLSWFKQGPAAEDPLSPDRIADVACFLASDLAADISGVAVGVQGKKVWRYKMHETAQRTPLGGESWSPKELSERWKEISEE
jgi:NAD(P)-dependent dehydrogenase (short-subunit alcohol dehydrogenase family)